MGDLDDRIRIAGPLRYLIILFVAHASVHAKTLYFPHYGDGGGLRMTFVVSNHSEDTATGTLSVFDPSGELSPLPFEDEPESVVELKLVPDSSKVLRTLGTSNPIRTGFVRVDLDQEDVSGVAIFKLASGLEASVLPSPLGRRFSLFVERASNLDTWIAIYRRQMSHPVTLKLYDAKGDLVVETTHGFPGSQAARFLSELFPNLATEFRGSLVAESSAPFALLGLRFGGSILSTIPVVPLVF